MLKPRDARLLVAIPAWNEEQSLRGVIEELRTVAGMPPFDILVINDGSTDRTSDVARSAGVAVLDLPINLGVGGAMRSAFKFGLRRGYAAVVQLDADGQHDANEIPTLIACMENQSADIVIGARFAGKGEYRASGPRRLAMRFLSATLSRVSGARLDDTTSGFKVAGPAAIALFAREYPAEYLGDTVESLVIAARGGLVVAQVPVAMRPRSAGNPSHSPLKAAIFLARAVFALLVALSRPKPAQTRSSNDGVAL